MSRKSCLMCTCIVQPFIGSKFYLFSYTTRHTKPTKPTFIIKIANIFLKILRKSKGPILPMITGKWWPNLTPLPYLITPIHRLPQIRVKSAETCPGNGLLERTTPVEINVAMETRDLHNLTFIALRKVNIHWRVEFDCRMSTKEFVNDSMNRLRAIIFYVSWRQDR